jgi:hypothetical protein
LSFRGRFERLGQHEYVTAGNNYPAGVEFNSRSNHRGKAVLPVKLSLGFLVGWQLDLVPLSSGPKINRHKGFTRPGGQIFEERFDILTRAGCITWLEQT